MEMLVEEKQKEEESSKIQAERCVLDNREKSMPFQQNHRGNVTGFIGVRKVKGGKFGAQIKDPIKRKSIWLGCFNTAEEASKAYMLKKQEFLATLQSVKKPSIGLVGIRRKKSGRFGVKITDPIRHKQVCLGTFDTVEEASQAYLSKKSEFEKLVKVNQGKEATICVESSDEASCLRANVHGKKLSDRCIYTVTNHPKARRSLFRSRGQKNGWSADVVRDLIRHNKVLLATSGTKSCDQIQPVGASLSVDNDRTLNVASVGSKRAIDSQETTHFVGVRKRNSGRYSSEIYDRTSKKVLYLGIFDTAEEASQAYQSKKLEIQKLVKAKQQDNRQTHSSATEKQQYNRQTDGKEKLVNAKQDNMPTDFERSKTAELQDNMPTHSSAGTNRKGQEDEDLWMGQWVKLPGNREINFSLKLGVPIIDNYGSLLGDFRSLDNLRFC